MLVINASAVVELLTADPSEIPELAQRVRSVEWMSAPDLIDYEVLNVLRKMSLRGDIGSALADSSRLALRDLRLLRYPMTSEMSDRVWQLRHNVSVYDGSYVALAERLAAPLVTTDGRLAAGVQALTPIDIESYVAASP